MNMENYEESVFGDNFGQYVEDLPKDESLQEDGAYFEDEEQTSYPGQMDDFEETDPIPSDDFITSLLKRNGINRHAIPIENENGELEEVNFDDLSEEDKLALYDQVNEPAISNDEIKTLNYLRINKMSLADMINWQREEAVKDYLAQAQQPRYSVDSLTDDELFAFDLQDRYPDMTDEEMAEELESAKSNEGLYKKKISALRQEYKSLEEEHNKSVEEQEKHASEQQFNQLAESLVNVARNTNEIHDLVLEDEDKEAVLSFLLDRDANGQSKFYKLFNDPEQMFKLAWYAVKGEEAFNSINDYYKGVIEKTRRSQTQPARAVRKQSTTKKDVFDLESQYRNI